MHKVTAIIIFYNSGEALLREAIESVFAQTFEDWELLLVDDGTTDGTDAVAQEYATAYVDRVRYLHHADRKNCGMSATRNLGIKHAQGEYVAFLDADDVWMPTILAEQAAILDRERNAQMVYGLVLRWYSWDPESPREDFVARPLSTYDRVVPPPELLEVMLTHSQGAPLGVMCRKSTVYEIGGYVDTFRGMCEDLAFFSKMCMSHSVYVSSSCLYYYRQHSKSAVSEAFRKGTRDQARIDFYEWFLSYAEDRICPTHIQCLVINERKKLRRRIFKRRIRNAFSIF